MVVPAAIVPQVVVNFLVLGGHLVLDGYLLGHLPNIVARRGGRGVPPLRWGWTGWWSHNFSIGGDLRKATSVFPSRLGPPPAGTVTAPRSIDGLAETLSGRRHGEMGDERRSSLLNGEGPEGRGER